MMENGELMRLREEIDGIDEQLLTLFAERMRLVGAISACKGAGGLPTRDEKREAEILSRVRDRAGEELADDAETLFRCLLALSRASQERLRRGADT